MALDGFFFDVEKWFGSIAAQRMSFAEKGVYLLMLFQEWRAPEKSLPDDAEAVADLIAVSDTQAAEVITAWPVVRRKFVRDERTGRLFNVALEKTRRKQARNRRDHIEAGRVGGKVSAANRRIQKELDGKRRLSVAVANSTEESSREKSRGEEIREDKKSAASASPVFRFPCQGPIRVWDLTDAQIAYWTAQYPGLDVLTECRKALAWCEAKPQKRKTARGMPGFLVNWFNRAVDERGHQSPVPQSSPLRDKYDRWSEECAQLHGRSCGNFTTHEIRMAREAQAASA